MELFDCIIIGGGPGGLTAGVYLQRYRRNILILDSKQSRASLIPKTHNYPGFPNGISGKELLFNLNTQFDNHEGTIIYETAKDLMQEDNYFKVTTSEKNYFAKFIILATGVVDIEPSLPNLTDSIKRGLIHHCAICDAYEYIDKNIAVIGFGQKGIKEALFLHNYTSRISIVTLDNPQKYSRSQILKLNSQNISLITESLRSIQFLTDKTCEIITNNKKYHFDTVYSALGCVINNALAIQIKAKLNQNFIQVNKSQETSVKRVFAIGDVVPGLNQICVAASQGAIAATKIHNEINKLADS